VELWPKGVKGENFREDVRLRFMSEYNKINYERVMAQPAPEDFLAEELANEYSLNAMMYGGLLKRQGDARGNIFYRMAFSAGEPRKFLWPYIHFLLGDGQEKEAFSLLETLKAAGGERGQFAEFLERKAKSAVSAEGLSR
jgi:hypothetical protein